MAMRRRDDVPSVGRFSPAHGNAKASGESLVFEAVPDGVRDAEPAPAPTGPKVGGRPFDSQTARLAALRRHALAKVPDFIRQELEYVPVEDFQPFDQGRRGLLDAKVSELVAMTGEVGVGVSTTVRGYSWLVAIAEFYAVRFAKTGSDDDADRARRFFKDASIELAKAHELARAEGAARRTAERAHGGPMRVAAVERHLAAVRAEQGEAGDGVDETTDAEGDG